MPKKIYLLEYVIVYTDNGITDIRKKQKVFSDINKAMHYGLNYNSFGIPKRELIHYEIKVVAFDFEYIEGKSGSFKKN